MLLLCTKNILAVSCVTYCAVYTIELYDHKFNTVLYDHKFNTV